MLSVVVDEIDHLIVWDFFFNFHGLQVGVTIALTIKRQRTPPLSLTF